MVTNEHIKRLEREVNQLNSIDCIRVIFLTIPDGTHYKYSDRALGLATNYNTKALEYFKGRVFNTVEELEEEYSKFECRNDLNILSIIVPEKLK